MSKKTDEYGTLSRSILVLDDAARLDRQRLKAVESLLYKKFGIKLPDADSGA